MSETKPIQVLAAMDSDGHIRVVDPHNLQAVYKLLHDIDDGDSWANNTDELGLEITSEEQFIEFVNAQPKEYKNLLFSFNVEHTEYIPHQ